MKCPSCKDDKTLSMTERLGIEIDYCPECRGVWLDRGELDKIIQKTQSEQAAGEVLPREKTQEVVYRDSSHHHKDKDYYKHKRKKSFLEELFD